MATQHNWTIRWGLVMVLAACGGDRESTTSATDTSSFETADGFDTESPSQDMATTADAPGETADDTQLPSNMDVISAEDDSAASSCPQPCGFGNRCIEGACQPTHVIFARISHTKKVGLTGTAYSGEAFACTLQPNPKGPGNEVVLLEKEGCKATVVRAGITSTNPSHVPVADAVGSVVFSGLAVKQIQLFPGTTLESACVKHDLPGEAGPFTPGAEVTISAQLVPDLPDQVSTTFESPQPVSPIFGELVWGQPLALSWDAQGADFVVVGFSAADPVSQDTGLILCTFPDTGRATISGDFIEFLPVTATYINSAVTRYFSHHDEPVGIDSVVEIQGFSQHQQVLSYKSK